MAIIDEKGKLMFLVFFLISSLLANVFVALKCIIIAQHLCSLIDCYLSCGFRDSSILQRNVNHPVYCLWKLHDIDVIRSHQFRDFVFTLATALWHFLAWCADSAARKRLPIGPNSFAALPNDGFVLNCYRLNLFWH